MKKLLSLGLAVVLAMSLGMAAFASSSTTIANSSLVQIDDAGKAYVAACVEGSLIAGNCVFVTCAETGMVMTLDDAVQEAVDNLWMEPLYADYYNSVAVGSYKPLMNGTEAIVLGVPVLDPASKYLAIGISALGERETVECTTVEDGRIATNFTIVPMTVSLILLQ